MKEKVDVTDPAINIEKEPLLDLNKNKFKIDEYILNKIKNKENLSIEKNNIIFNTGNGDCWFNVISQALFDDEKYHLSIRKKIYDSLLLKKEFFSKNHLTVNVQNNIVLIEDYINEIKFSSNWAGDLEISETSLIYNCNIILYKYESNNEYICNLSYFNSYGYLDNKNKTFIFITFANNNHYQLINLVNEFNILNIENNNYNLYEYNSDNTKKNE